MPRKPRALSKPRRSRRPPVTYTLAHQVSAIAQRILDPRGRVIPGAKDLEKSGGVLPGLTHLRQHKILYLFTTAEKVGRHAAATASRFAKKHLPLSEDEYTYEIVVAKPVWDGFTEDQRFALVYHELLHCGVNEKEVPTIKRHDLEEFGAVVRHFGLWNERAKFVGEQLYLFDQAARVRVVK